MNSGSKKTNYSRGRDTEYKAIKDLEKVGYIATRAAGSHGAWDVIAINPKIVRLIQIKRCKDRLDKFELEREQLEQIKVPANCQKELWVWVDRNGWVVQDVI